MIDETINEGKIINYEWGFRDGYKSHPMASVDSYSYQNGYLAGTAYRMKEKMKAFSL